VWISPKYKSYVLNQMAINEGSYVCEVLTPLFSIALGDLSVKDKTWRICDMASWPDTIPKGDSRITYRPDLIFIAYLNNQRIDLLNMETGNNLRIYNMYMEYGILKNCLLTQATIPLHAVSANTVYPLIHSLLTLRTAIICTLQKLSIYLENKLENSDNSDEQIAKTINPPKRHKSNLKLKSKRSSDFKNVSTS
ncbi:12622_t:CDS:2, partial [Dentiscutata heterogama]